MSDPDNLARAGRGFWWGLWTASKLTVVLVICIAVALLMLTSSQPTVTPAAAVPTALPVATVATGPVSGPTPTLVPTVQAPQDTFVPDRLFVVKGHALYNLHNYAMVPVNIVPGIIEPSVTTDGKQIAYVRVYKNYQDLYVYNTVTGANTQITDNRLSDPNNASTGLTAATPAFSDDGKSLFFSWSYPGAQLAGSTNYDRTDLSVHQCVLASPCNQNTATQLTQPTFQSGGDTSPAPRPLDPNTFVYAKFEYETVDGVNPRSLGFLVSHDISSGSEVQLTPLDPSHPQAISISQPAWTANGRYLAFTKTSDDVSQTSIYVMTFHPPGDPADFTKARLLVHGAPFASNPVFSPDGKYLAFLQDTGNGMHLYIARVHLGKNATIDTPKLVMRAGIVDSGDGGRLVWTR